MIVKKCHINQLFTGLGRWFRYIEYVHEIIQHLNT